MKEPGWNFERSSGYAGYRCLNCGTWVYANGPMVCDCNRSYIKPVGVDVDGNGLWTDGNQTWNSGEPLPAAELNHENQNQ